MVALRLSQPDAAAVTTALDLLGWYAPEHLAHFCREITEVTYSRSACGIRGVLACTGAHLRRRVVLAMPPSQMDLIELAVVLSHEARHHYTDDSGRHWTIPHTCSDCSNLFERAFDAIYVGDEELRSHLHAHLIPVTPLSAAYEAGIADAFTNFGFYE